MERYRQIARTLTRHGFGYLADVLGLARFLPLHHALKTPSEYPHPHLRPHSQPEHVRMALEELGATFIKLGQILSTRADLLPPEYLAELSKLQDAAPSVPVEKIRRQIESELGKPVEELFATFDPVPLAAASIGQAHAATLTGGEEVVVKVRRPGVVAQIENDLDILQNLASTASRRWQIAEQYDVVGLAQEFAQTLRAELDYIQEGHNAERFADNFRNDPDLHIPKIYWELTTSRVLTLERIKGIKITDFAALDAAGIDRGALAERAVHLSLKMAFEDGFFHADPHPGNFFIEPGGRIGLIDFGMVGTVGEHTRGQLTELLLAITSQDASRLVDAFLDLGVARRRIDRTILRQDMEHLVSRYYGRELQDINITALLNDSMAVVRRHSLQMPSTLALMIKTVVMDEGLGAQLDPEFNLATILAPYGKRLVLHQYSPMLWASKMSRASLEIANLGFELPAQVRRMMNDLERGGLQVGMRPEGIEPMLRRLERIANRIVLGIVVTGFIIGLAILLAFYRPPNWEQWIQTLFMFGFVAAMGLGGYLAWSILRSGRG